MSPRERLRQIEQAFAREASAHAAAALELNPYGEAEALELGDARAVYTGQWSSVHGVMGLGLDGPVEERDLREVERFFHRKERSPAFWVTPETDPSLLELLGRDYRIVRSTSVHGCALPADAELPAPSGASREVDHRAWTLALTQQLDPYAKEPGLLALTKLHQKETRFYLGGGSASYTFFHSGLALVPSPGAHSLLALQVNEAAEFRSTFFATGAVSPLPFLYERTLHERL
jgi:hypothetical protein